MRDTAAAAFQNRNDEAPFDAVAPTYDETFTSSHIGRAQRELITRELDHVFHAGERVLELNCGTGIDAIHLAGRGVKVLACDISSRMIEMARQSAARAGRKSCLPAPAAFRALATEEIGRLRREGLDGQFDGALSNFAGLNCIADLRSTACDLAALLKPGAPFLLCVFGHFCAWEVIWYLGHGKPSKAFRRLRRAGSVVRLADGASVWIHYPPVRELARIFAPEFKLKKWSGIGITVPPTYLETFAIRFPKLFNVFSSLDRGLGSLPLARGMADHVLLKFERDHYDRSLQSEGNPV
ncbi:MAG: class I SAM-dependent DNA methyltransferase [Terriglobia bacterium]